MAPIGSLTPLRVEMALISGGAVVDIPAVDYLQSIEMELVTGGAWTATISLFDRDFDFLEKLMVVAGADRFIEFSFGRGESYPEENRTFRGAILQYNPTFEPIGMSVVLELVPGPVLAALLDKRILGFSEGRRVSDVVREIASNRDWTTTDSQGRDTIEETVDLMSEPFSTNGESDMAAIRDRLQPQAVNGDGEGGFLFYFDEDGAVHFHTPNYLDPVSHSFTFARGGSGDVISFSPSDTSIFGALMGGGNSVFGGVSSFDGAAIEASGSLVEGIDASGVSVEADSGSKIDLGSGTHAYIDLKTRDSAELTRLARSRFDKFKRYSYQADMQTLGTHRVRTTDFVDIQYVKEDGTLHYLSGRFRAFKVKHTVDMSGWLTDFEMLREGLEGVEGLATVAATKVNTPTEAVDQSGSVQVSVET